MHTSYGMSGSRHQPHAKLVTRRNLAGRAASNHPSHARQVTIRRTLSIAEIRDSRSSRTSLRLKFWRFDTCLRRMLLTLLPRMNDEPENAPEKDDGENKRQNNRVIHDFSSFAPE